MNTVIQVVQHLSPGGIEVMALELKRINQQHNDRMLIVSLEGDKSVLMARWPRLQEMESELFFLNKKPGIDFTTILRLVELFKKEHATAIHTHHIGPLLYAGIAGRLAKVSTIVHTEHDIWHLQNTKRLIIQRLALAIVRPTLIADAQMVANGMKKYLRRNDIGVVTNGIDVDRFSPGDKAAAREVFGLPKNVKLVGISGRMEEVKGHKVLVQALEYMDDSVHLVLAGDGSLAEGLRDLATVLGMSQRVHFLGQIDDMPNFYRALNVFCLSSFQEGMPLAPLEAQSCGIPAVITNVGGAAETLCKKTGSLVPAGDSHALAKALTKQLEKKIQVNPRVFVERHGNVIQMAQAYAKLCNSSFTVAAARV